MLSDDVLAIFKESGKARASLWLLVGSALLAAPNLGRMLVQFLVPDLLVSMIMVSWSH